MFAVVVAMAVGVVSIAIAAASVAVAARDVVMFSNALAMTTAVVLAVASAGPPCVLLGAVACGWGARGAVVGVDRFGAVVAADFRLGIANRHVVVVVDAQLQKVYCDDMRKNNHARAS